MTSSLNISVWDNTKDIEKILPEWETLLEQAPSATIFSTWEWLGSWWRSFGHGELFVLGFYQAGELVGLAPLCVTERSVAVSVKMKVLCFLGDGSGDSDNLDIIAKSGYEDAVAEALLQHLKALSGPWQLIQLNTMPSGSPVGARLVPRMASREWTTFERSKPASSIDLPDTWKEYLGRLASEDRNNLTRYRKRLSKRHAAKFYKATTREEVDFCLQTLYRLHQQRWQLRGESGSFASTDRRNFYSDISHLFMARGWLELWALEVDGLTVAVQFAFRYRDHVFQLQEGFDPQYSSDRVGMLLRGHVIEQLIAERIKCYDFLGGEPGYKSRWGAVKDHYIYLQFARRRSLGSAYLLLMKNAMNGKQTLRNKLPKFAWDILHHVNAGLMGRHATKA